MVESIHGKTTMARIDWGSKRMTVMGEGSVKVDGKVFGHHKITMKLEMKGEIVRDIMQYYKVPFTPNPQNVNKAKRVKFLLRIEG
jgi:hypothetical protein